MFNSFSSLRSRLMSVLFVVLAGAFVFGTMACTQPETVTETNTVYGTWTSTYCEKYVVAKDTALFENYYTNSKTKELTLYYTCNEVSVVPETETTGYIYGKFNDESHIGYGATVGQWYAVYYKNLTATSVSLSQASGNKAAVDTLDDAKKEFTVDNGYFAYFSECTKAE